MEYKNQGAKYDEPEEFLVTNLDDGEQYRAEDIAEAFRIVRLDDADQADAKIRDGEEEEEDDRRFDAKGRANNSEKASYGEYNPVDVPDGALLQFFRISAVGSTRDSAEKPYSVFYLDVRCKIAAPSSWYVYRRYSQFRRLSDVLRSEGYYVPVLPPKKFLGTFDVDFVKQRMKDLENWLFQLIDMPNSHPGSKDPQNNPFFRKFLTEDANRPPILLQRIYPEHSADSERKGERSKVSLEDFELVKVIGKGSFGKVTLVRKKTDHKLYAMKVLVKSNIVKRRQVEHTKAERRILETINHPFIAKLHNAFQTNEKLFFVLDYAAGGELFFHLSRMKKFPEHVARFYCAEITLALEALHTFNVIYRDLKPENILLDSEGHVKLVDFGLAKEGVSDAAEGAHSFCGTNEYLSPEVIDRQGHGFVVDWWSLGMVAYEMLTGLPPWYTQDRDKLFENLRSAPLKFPMSVARTPALFIQALLNRNPLKRLGANGGAEVRRHAFFSTIDWDALYNRRIQPPFEPCRSSRGDEDTINFEQEFTNMPVQSVDDAVSPLLKSGDPAFLHFTYEEESTLETLRDSFVANRRK
jgi:serine/threonine protein kinase